MVQVPRARRSRRPRNDFPWSHRIVEARREAGLTQEGLGKLIGASQSIVGDWELGLKKPGLDRFEAIATATGKTASWLIFGFNVPAGDEGSVRELAHATEAAD